MSGVVRKVWIVDLPAYGDTEEGQVLIEQFDDCPPTIAFRQSPHHVWGRPYQSVEGR